MIEDVGALTARTGAHAGRYSGLYIADPKGKTSTQRVMKEW